MPAAPSLPNAEPAELLLEQLLQAWSWSDEDDLPEEPERSPFAPAFLPPASPHVPRPLAVRLAHDRLLPNCSTHKKASSSIGMNSQSDVICSDAALAPDAPGGPDHGTARANWRKSGRAARRGRSFQQVEDGVRRAADPPRPPVPHPLAADLDGEDGSLGFAARVMALKAAGALDQPSAWGGGSPVPAGYGELYADDDAPRGGAVMDDPGVGRVAAPVDGGVPRSPAGEAAGPAPRSIYL